MTPSLMPTGPHAQQLPDRLNECCRCHCPRSVANPEDVATCSSNTGAEVAEMENTCVASPMKQVKWRAKRKVLRESFKVASFTACESSAVVVFSSEARQVWRDLLHCVVFFFGALIVVRDRSVSQFVSPLCEDDSACVARSRVGLSLTTVGQKVVPLLIRS